MQSKTVYSLIVNIALKGFLEFKEMIATHALIIALCAQDQAIARNARLGFIMTMTQQNAANAILRASNAQHFRYALHASILA